MKNAMKMAAMAAVLMFSANVNAQEEYGAEKGAFSTELQFNPFSNNFETFKIDGLSFRYFFSENSALRLNLNVGVNSNKEGHYNVEVPNKNDANYDDLQKQYDVKKDCIDKTSNTNFGLNLGYEYHFAKYGRADLYAGAQIGFNTESWSYTEESMGTLTDKEGKPRYVKMTTEEKGRYDDKFSSFTFKAGVFTGIDFYLTKSLYAGAELGINFATTTSGNYDKTYQYIDTNELKEKTVSYENNISETNLKFNVIPALRLGWKF